LWLFEDHAENYGNFLKENNIDEIPVYLTSNNDRNFANQLWFRNLDGRSVLYGDYRNLYYDFRVRGVLKDSEAARSRKSSGNIQAKLPYTQGQLSKVLRTTENVRKGLAGNKSLENVTKFLEKLKQ
jgi:hypothetical protein